MEIGDGYILLTGAAGYVGTHVLVELIQAGHKPLALDNRADVLRDSMAKIFDITGYRVDGVCVDLMDKTKLCDIFNKYKITYVLHLAGLKAVRESHVSPLMYYNINVVGTINLLEVMSLNDVCNIIFSSSSKVYGVPQYLPLDEKHPTGNCTNPYGRTKYMVEQILQDLVNSDKRWKVTILRYFNPCGAHSSGKLGDDVKDAPKNLMPRICCVACGKQKEFTVYGSDYNTHDGTVVKDYTHVVDLAKGHILAMKFQSSTQNYRVFNLGTRSVASILDMVKLFEKISGNTVNFCDKQPGDIAVCSADSSKAFKELGWKAEKSLENMCEDMWRWMNS